MKITLNEIDLNSNICPGNGLGLGQTSVVDHPMIYTYIRELEGISIFSGRKNSADPFLYITIIFDWIIML